MPLDFSHLALEPVFLICFVLLTYSAPELPWCALKSDNLGHWPISWKHFLDHLLACFASCGMLNKLAVYKWSRCKNSSSESQNPRNLATHSLQEICGFPCSTGLPACPQGMIKMVEDRNMCVCVCLCLYIQRWAKVSL